MQYTTVLFITFLHYVSACSRDETTELVFCSIMEDIPKEATRSWDKLLVYNKENSLSLRKDLFQNAQNLIFLEGHNIATMVDGTFNGLDKLTELNLYYVKMNELPPNIFRNLPVRDLTISRSNLKSLQPGLLRMPKIDVVHLNNNNINEIKKGVFDNSNIRGVYVHSNQITSISNRAFEKMARLTHLSLDENLLTTFNTQLYLGNGHALQVLWLSKNKLTKITKDMFTTVPQLTTLYLQLNQIVTIEKGSFHNMPNLKELDLSNNKLQHIPHNVFPLSGVNNFNLLSLHNNQLTFINEAMFYRMPNLKYITYGGNPFQCPCYHQLSGVISERNVKRLCDTTYLQGERPTCALSSIAAKKCLYDEDLTDDVLGVYQDAIDGYPKIEIDCNTTMGYENAFLSNYNSN